MTCGWTVNLLDGLPMAGVSAFFRRQDGDHQALRLSRTTRFEH